MNVDPDRFQKATAVVRAVRSSVRGADKYAWYQVKVLQVLKNDSSRKIGESLEVAARSGDAGVPLRECTLYLEPYNTEKDPSWKLLGGTAEQGVSHVAFDGFPVLPPVANADPSKRRETEFQLPARLRTTRDDDRLSIAVDPASVKPVKLSVGANMITGLRQELSVYRGDQKVVSGYGGLQGGGPNLGELGTLILNRRIDGIPRAGEAYTVKLRLTLFETDIPPQHMWSPESGRYRVLWTRTLEQNVD